MTLTVDELLQYVRCPLEWFWERRAHVPRPLAANSMTADGLRQAQAFFYEGHAPTLRDALRMVWQDWADAWGQATLPSGLDRYAQGRAAILELFERGRVTRPDGRRYTAPRLTNEYRNRMHSGGLTDLGRGLDEVAQKVGLSLGDDGENGSLADAYADGLAAAERMGPQLPSRDVVLGWQVAYGVELPNGWSLAGMADLVWRAEAERGASAVVLEVHDLQDTAWVRAGLAGRDLRVIAASMAQPVPDQAPTWERVDRVVYRQWLAGQTFTFRETNPGHLVAVAAAAVRGIETGVVIPRALAGYQNCQVCPHRERCWDERGWEALALIDDSALARATRVQELANAARAKLQGNGEAARLAREAVDSIANGLREMSDSVGVAALLAESRHVVEGLESE